MLDRQTLTNIFKLLESGRFNVTFNEGAPMAAARHALTAEIQRLMEEEQKALKEGAAKKEGKKEEKPKK